MSLDDRIRAAARELDGPMDLARSVSAYWQVEERYRTEMATAATAGALHRRAVGVESYLQGEEAARKGQATEAEALFAAAARHGVGELDDEREVDPFDAVVAAARAGGRLAVEMVLEEIWPFVRALTATVVSGAQSVDDMTRVISLAAVTALPEYDPKVPFLEFVHRVASRFLAMVPTSTTEPDPRMAVARVLRHLPSKQRDVLVLRILMGFSSERTAEVLRTTPGAVRVAQHKALARLRAELDQPPADNPRPTSGSPSRRQNGGGRDETSGTDQTARRPRG